MRSGLALIPLAFGAAMLGYVARGAQGPVASAVQASTGGSTGREDYVTLDRAAEPLKSAFNADVGKTRILMLVAPT